MAQPKTTTKFKTADDRAPDVPRVAYTVPEFCAAHRVSLSMYYKMRAAGKGPREGHAGTKVIITHESAANWREKIESQPV